MEEVPWALNSKIEWTTHTFNPWWGCTKVSEACKHCYAETWAKRVGHNVWGPKPQRRVMSENHWKQPLKWNRDAEGIDERPRVFCASMADVFEDRDELRPHRVRLFELIEKTPNLDWLLLTKRPQNIGRMAHWTRDWPDNVWLGTTIEMQHRAEELLPYLEAIPAKVRFISAEPLLGPLSIEPWLGTSIDWVITVVRAVRRRVRLHPSGSALFTHNAWRVKLRSTSSNGATGHLDRVRTFQRVA